MDQDQRLNAIMDRVRGIEALEEIPVPQELAEPKSFLKVLRANHYNWSSQHFRKLFGMRFRVKLPPRGTAFQSVRGVKLPELLIEVRSPST